MITRLEEARSIIPSSEPATQWAWFCFPLRVLVIVHLGLRGTRNKEPQTPMGWSCPPWSQLYYTLTLNTVLHVAFTFVCHDDSLDESMYSHDLSILPYLEGLSYSPAMIVL